MIKLKKIQCYEYYNNLKNSFKNGIEASRSPFNCAESVDTVILNENLKNITEDLYSKQSLSDIIRKGVETVNADFDIIKQISEDRIRETAGCCQNTTLKEAFTSGMKNPDVCLMALYDALAEWVLNLARAQASKKPPVKVISSEVSKIFADENISDTYRNLLKQIKKLSPKRGRARINIIKRDYQIKIENGINEILRTMAAPKN